VEAELRKIAAVLDLVLVEVQQKPETPWLVSVRLGVRRNPGEVVAANPMMCAFFAAQAHEAGLTIRPMEG
jgi:hypothetical protein